MATPWNTIGPHGVDQRDSDLIPLPYDDTISSQQSYAQWSSEPSTSTSPFLLSPPPPSHLNRSSSTSPNQLYIAPGQRISRGPPSPLDLQSPRSPNSPGYQTLQRGHLISPASLSPEDPFATPRATVFPSTNLSPRPRNSHGKIDALLEQPYYDSPPDTAGSRGKVTFRGAMEIIEPTEVRVRDGWRPDWLRHRIIGIFLGIFLVLAVLGEIVNWMISGKDWSSRVEGLWTFGPVIVTCILAMLWKRVEEQALLYTPWIILEGRPASGEETRRKQAHRTILLDYPAMGSFKALIKAFTNRHHLVVASVAASLVLRAQIVLSTGVFHAVIEADGSRILRVRAGMLHAMAGMFCLLGALLLPMMYHAPSKNGIAPCDPTSAAATAALLANSGHFVARLGGTGSAPMDGVAAKLTGSWYTTEVHRPGRKHGEVFQLKQLGGGLPVSVGNDGSNQSVEWVAQYRPWTIGVPVQVMSIIASVIVIAGLWAIYSIRGGGDGFEVSQSVFILWTFVPTLILFVPVVLWNRIDIDTRRLTPFLKLTVSKYRFKESLGLTYMNEFGAITAIKAVRRKDWGVFIKKCMAMLAWLLPIFTAGLFAITEVAKTAHLHLQPETEFRSTTKSLESTLNKELIDRILIRSSPSYPSWTYEDMAFPELELTDHPSTWPLPNTALTATVPALRAVLACETISLTNGAGADLKCSALGSSSSNKTAICGSGISSVGRVVSSCSGLATDYALNYIWGDCADDGFISVMRCNESLYDVDVAMTFHTEDLTIDTDDIPLENLTSQANSTVEVEVSSAYSALDDMYDNNSTLAGLDGFFRTLISSRLDIRLERLLAPVRQNAVGEYIRLQHGILGAQVLNSNLVRHTLSSSKVRARADDDSLIDATVNYYISRLTQGRTQTIVLAVFLALALVLSVLAMRTTHRGAPLPKDPGSIASQASLLADSTIWARFPPGAAWMDDDDLARCFRRKTFRHGWYNTGGNGRKYGICIVQDEGKMARPVAELDATETGDEAEVPGRYISMAPGLYSYGDVVAAVHEKE